MATIRLNNLTKPRAIVSGKTESQIDVFSDKPIYTDLHLDLEFEKSIGLNDNYANSGDIKVDINVSAIRNSIRNIFETKRGQKILTPEFGASLEQHLFQVVDEYYGNVIGDEILSNLEKFESRIDVEKVQILPIPDENLYRIFVSYRIKQSKQQNTIDFTFSDSGEILI